MANQGLFEKNIISLLGLEELPDSEKERLLNRISNIVQKKVFLRVMDELSEEQQDEFLQALDAQDQVTVERILKDNVENLEEIIKEEVVNIKEDLKDTVNSLDISS